MTKYADLSTELEKFSKKRLTFFRRKSVAERTQGGLIDGEQIEAVKARLDAYDESFALTRFFIRLFTPIEQHGTLYRYLIYKNIIAHRTALSFQETAQQKIFIIALLQGAIAMLTKWASARQVNDQEKTKVENAKRNMATIYQKAKNKSEKVTSDKKLTPEKIQKSLLKIKRKAKEETDEIIADYVPPRGWDIKAEADCVWLYQVGEELVEKQNQLEAQYLPMPVKPVTIVRNVFSELPKEGTLKNRWVSAKKDLLQLFKETNEQLISNRDSLDYPHKKIVAQQVFSKRYRDLANVYHPDKDAKFKDELTVIFQEILGLFNKEKSAFLDIENRKPVEDDYFQEYENENHSEIEEKMDEEESKRQEEQFQEMIKKMKEDFKQYEESQKKWNAEFNKKLEEHKRIMILVVEALQKKGIDVSDVKASLLGAPAPPSDSTSLGATTSTNSASFWKQGTDSEASAFSRDNTFKI